MKLVLTDHGGNPISRFGATGVKRVLMNPTRCKSDDKHNDYALVWCEVSEVYIMREGYGINYTLKLIYWDSDGECIEEEFTDMDKAINKFLKQCKRKVTK